MQQIGLAVLAVLRECWLLQHPVLVLGASCHLDPSHIPLTNQVYIQCSHLSLVDPNQAPKAPIVRMPRTDPSNADLSLQAKWEAGM